ncbi:alpha/beta hydrolase, partial [Nonomuraea ceibae]|uniref:alpha/beta hydrolase n=1 Tax=Nonomuraea ceibae TaxID=1935170 RepID=UPI001C5DB4C4
MTSNGPTDQHVADTLCPPLGDATTVQLLIPGGLYGHASGRMRGDRRHPSHRETTTAAEDATPAIDRLGNRVSSSPPSAPSAQHTHQIVTHELIRQLRESHPGRSRFAKTVLTSHWLGSTRARTAASAQPAEVDGVIPPGESSAPNKAAAEQMSTKIHHAPHGPRLAEPPLHDGYPTTPPGVRAAAYHHRPEPHPKPDPKAIDADRATPTNDVLPPRDPRTPPPTNKHPQAPVQTLNGEQDNLLTGVTRQAAHGT